MISLQEIDLKQKKLQSLCIQSLNVPPIVERFSLLEHISVIEG